MSALPLGRQREWSSPAMVGVVSPMARRNREHLLAALARNYRVWVFDQQAPDWATQYIVGFSITDVRDPESLLAAVAVSGVDALITWDELCAFSTAWSTQQLGLVGPEAGAVSRCRDKFLARTATREIGLPPCTSVAISDVATARAAAKLTGLPAVLKPRSLTGSIGTVKVTSIPELETLVPRVLAASIPGLDVDLENRLVLESYLSGPEISVDALIVNGEVHPAFVAHKTLGFDPYFEEVEHVVDADDPLLADPDLLEALQSAHEALAFTHGWTHSEWRLTADGPALIEVNPRIGGDLISFIGTLATGLEASLITARAALGEATDVTRTRQRVAAVRFVYPETSVSFSGLTVDESRLSSAVHSVVPLAEPGQLLLLPPASHGLARAAAIICVDSDVTAVRFALEEASAAITVQGAPV